MANYCDIVVNKALLENQKLNSTGNAFYVASDSKLHLKGLTVKNYDGLIVANDITENTMLIENSVFENLRSKMIYAI